MIISHNSFITIADLFFKLLDDEVLHFGLSTTPRRQAVIGTQVTAWNKMKMYRGCQYMKKEREREREREKERERGWEHAHCIMQPCCLELVCVYEREREGAINTNREDKKITKARNCVFAIVVFNQGHYTVYREKPCSLYGPAKVHNSLMIFVTVSVSVEFTLWQAMPICCAIHPPLSQQNTHTHTIVLTQRITPCCSFMQKPCNAYDLRYSACLKTNPLPSLSLPPSG